MMATFLQWLARQAASDEGKAEITTALRRGMKTSEGLFFMGLAGWLVYQWWSASYVEQLHFLGLCGCYMVFAWSRGMLKEGAAEASLSEAKPLPKMAPTLADDPRPREEPSPSLSDALATLERTTPRPRITPATGLALALAMLVSACGAPAMVPDRPDHATAITCDAVEPLHRRMEIAVRAGELDHRLDDVARLNASYRRICAEGLPATLEAEALMGEFLLILERQH